jgi:hypothetical protein
MKPTFTMSEEFCYFCDKTPVRPRQVFRISYTSPRDMCGWDFSIAAKRAARRTYRQKVRKGIEPWFASLSGKDSK